MGKHHKERRATAATPSIAVPDQGRPVPHHGSGTQVAGLDAALDDRRLAVIRRHYDDGGFLINAPARSK